jgi:hypothetical protein
LWNPGKNKTKKKSGEEGGGNPEIGEIPLQPCCFWKASAVSKILFFSLGVFLSHSFTIIPTPAFLPKSFACGKEVPAGVA